MQLVKAVSTFDERSSKGPGPGAYHVKEPTSQQKVSFSGRLADLSDKWALSVPGPGAYKTLELLDKNRKSNLSKFGNSPTVKFGNSKRKSEEEVR